MSTTYQWKVVNQQLLKWNTAIDDDIFESNTFSSGDAKVKWKLICSPSNHSNGEWWIRLKCVHIAKSRFGKTIRVNCYFKCKDQDSEQLSGELFVVGSLQQQQMTEWSPLTTIKSVKQSTRLKIICIIQETMTKQNDKFVWKIDKHMMSFCTPRDGSRIFSPYFPATSNNQDSFHIVCFKTEKYFEGYVEYDATNTDCDHAVAANIIIQIPETGAILKDGKVFYEGFRTRTFRWFERSLLADLPVITFQCKI
eukprot:180447_1